MASAHSTPRGRASSGRLSLDSQGSESVMLAAEQLRDLRAGRMGGDRPETKYLNKKRDLVRKLAKEKHEAVERGVKAKIQSYEGEMIDEMLQAALGLDVEEEVEKRVE